MNWGNGIAIFLTVFVLFILGLVYMTTRSTAELQAEDYYKQEIEYQDRIDAFGLGDAYAEGLALTWEQDQMVMRTEDATAQILDGGKVTFTRPNDSRLDRSFTLDFNAGIARFSGEEFTQGVYDILIEASGPDGPIAIEKDIHIKR
ncbi:MAG: hypothetical protein HKN79_04835 [Flavobacteriales bacterium]|nr:hypothetical protein [Flavobacteriales bacterium]